MNPARQPGAVSDDALLTRLAAGDLGALGELYLRHNAAIYRFIARLTANGPDVDDIVQETFLTMRRRAGSFDGRAPCRSWLIGIAARQVQRRNRALLRLRRAVGRLADHVGGREPATDPRPALDARSDLHTVQRAFARLSEAKRAVLLMDAEGMSCAEVASVLDIPIGTVWTRLHHARKELAAARAKGGR